MGEWLIRRLPDAKLTYSLKENFGEVGEWLIRRLPDAKLTYSFKGKFW